MLVIGNRKFRNLQEQVGYNTERIDDILAVLDGLNIQDNVVVIDDISTDLTLEEIAVVKQPVAFLIYNGSLYIKKNEDSDNAYFDIVFTISQNTVISFSTSEISVYLATGALSITNSTFTTYSETQIDTLLGDKADVTYVDIELAKKANLTGANFTGAITSPSIIENMSGYSFSSQPASDVTKTTIYAGAVKNGNKLTLVWFGSIKNDGEANRRIELGTFVLPSAVASKIYPYSVSPFDNVVCQADIIAWSSYISKKTMATLGRKTSTQITFDSYLTELTVGSTYLVRLEVTFLLSDSLAS